jgi:FAD:protein FMN transferase
MANTNPAAVIHSRRRLAMGTFATIELGGLDEDSAAAAMNSAFEVIASIEAQMHPTRAGGDLARLNGATSAGGILVSDPTFEVLALSQRLATASHGVFDPCLPEADGGIADLELGSDRAVRCHRHVAIDLGGIAKGYAIDRAVICLREHGAEEALVNIGGDLRSFGGDGFAIGIRLSAGKILRHILRDSALAVSDAEHMNGPAEHRGYYTRAQSRTLRRKQAAVLAPSAAVADALTKCALYCTATEWTALARQFDAQLIET